MNVPGPGSSVDFRRIEPKRMVPKSASTVQQQDFQTRLSLAGAGDKLSATLLTSLKGSDFSAGPAESEASDEAAETRPDEAISENSAEGLDAPDDLTDDLELAAERAEDQDEQTKKQRQPKGKRLDALETDYRCRFMALDRLLSRLAVTHDFLTRQIAGCPISLESLTPLSSRG